MGLSEKEKEGTAESSPSIWIDGIPGSSSIPNEKHGILTLGDVGELTLSPPLRDSPVIALFNTVSSVLVAATGTTLAALVIPNPFPIGGTIGLPLAPFPTPAGKVPARTGGVGKGLFPVAPLPALGVPAKGAIVSLLPKSIGLAELRGRV